MPKGWRTGRRTWKRLTAFAPQDDARVAAETNLLGPKCTPVAGKLQPLGGQSVKMIGLLARRSKVPNFADAEQSARLLRGTSNLLVACLIWVRIWEAANLVANLATTRFGLTGRAGNDKPAWDARWPGQFP